ncbi:MAG: FlgO family outer membrane protein [Verrucomicrobiota bacterium]
MKTFVQELKNRRVYRVAIAYLVGGSAVVQLAGTVLPIFHAPEWVQQTFVGLVAICFPMALVLAWTFDLRGGTLEKTDSGIGTAAAANQRRLWILVALGSFVAVSGLVAYWFWHPWRTASLVERAAIPIVTSKSIAVLPFENLSDEKEAAYFTEGVQDEILTHLARVADLKVISRTSVMQYKSGTTRNLREIATALGVAHVLEGTVQRSHGRVRISAQLIDARTDAHVWAERYDRELADVFGIQTEVAEKIVLQLKAKLSPREKAAIEERPTEDLGAYDLYLRARNLIDAIAFSARANENLLAATQLLQEAVGRDPTFLLAYYQLARAQDQIYFLGIDHTPERLALADAAVQETLRLRPDSGEAHLALAQHLYWGYRDYDRAREKLAIARRVLPNEPLVLVLAGYIDRRQGRWQQSIEEMERALELDPRNLFILQQISFSYENMRRYREMAVTLDRVLVIAPKDITTRVQRASIDLEAHADSRALHSAIQNIIAEDPEAAATLAGQWMLLVLCERDRAAARQVLAAISAEGSEEFGIQYPKAWYEGIVARAMGDSDGARAAFAAARVEIEKRVREQPTYAEPLSLLGMIDAGLGRKEEAIREGKHATELLPVSKDAISGPLLIENLAVIYAWTGEKEQALSQVAVVSSLPSSVNYGQLKLHPKWDPLRGDPRFEKIVDSLAPK